MKSLHIFIILAVAAISSAAQIGDSCNTDAECGMENSICPDSHCTCENKYVAKNDLTGCLPIRDGIREECLEREQCQRGLLGNLSSCIDLECRCRAEAAYVPIEGTCLLKATKIGDSCLADEQCIANLNYSRCEATKCICSDGAVAAVNGSLCLKKLKLGEKCDPNELAQCNHTASATCPVASNVCTCVVGYANPEGNNTICLKDAGQIGDNCTDPVQCKKLEGSVCNTSNNTCACEDGEVGSDDKMKCLEPVPNLGEDCTDSTQCLEEFSKCLPDASSDGSPKRCLCDNGYARNETFCVKSQPLGGPCTMDIECSNIGHNQTVKCLANICACPVTFPPSQFYNDQCVRPSMLNESCANHDNCFLGVNNRTYCVGSPSICKCSQDYIEREGKCWAQLKVGSSCSRDEECRQTISGPVRCDKYVCTCDSGFPDSAGGLRCTGSSLVNRAQYILVIFAALFVSMGFIKQ